jgi:hypothetical protein
MRGQSASAGIRKSFVGVTVTVGVSVQCCHRNSVTVIVLAPRDHVILRGAAVSALPVLGVPVGSISNRCTSSLATGRCSTPFGTM